MTFLTMLLIITRRGLVCRFQFIFRINEKTAEADDLISRHQAFFNSCIEFPLDTGLDFNRNILAAQTLNVDDSAGSLLDNGFVRYGKEIAPFCNYLHYVVRAVGMSDAGQGDFDHDAIRLGR